MSYGSRQPPQRARRGRFLLLPLLLALGFVAFQYLTAPKFVNPETGRVAPIALSSDQEEALGLQSYQEVLQQSRTVDSGPELQQVVGVARRLVQVVDPESKKFDWQVSLIESDQANAFCLPGGKIAIFTGILPFTQSEAGLATVMGHEIAHATSRHGAERMFKDKMVQTALMGAQGSVMEMDPAQQKAVLGALGAGIQYGIVLPYGRDHESEADEIGLMYMARAGYDPRESIAFWERMSQAGGQQPPEWASTHPAHGTRIERLKALMPKAMEAYQAALQAGPQPGPQIRR